MKLAKKLASFLLALIMVLSLGVTSFAEQEKGSITINGALKGNTFTLYKIFDLESYNSTNGTYAYTIRNGNPLYNTIKNMKMEVGEPAEEKNVFALTSKDADTDYVQLSVPFSNTQDDSPTIKTIASNLMTAIDGLSDTDKASLLVRKVDHLGDGQTTVPADGTGVTTTGIDDDKYDITFSDLDLGYYLVDSSAGAMIGLTTTKPDATIKAKNELPNVVKEVKKNVDNTWSKNNSKAVGETVEYRVQVAVKNGATNYVIYDSMSEGLTYGKITKVYYGFSTNTPAENVIYDINDPTKNKMEDLTEYFTYTKATTDAPITHNGKNCCFSMKFNDNFLKTVLNGTNATGYTRTIYVEYDATLNEKAVIGGGGNPNDVYMTYGDNNVDVANDTTITYTYQIELVKTKDDNTVLNGAEFELYATKEDSGNLKDKLTFVKSTDDTTGKTIYRVATAKEIADSATTTTTKIEAGDVIISGLGGNFDTTVGALGRRYYLKETKAPEGYTLLPAEKEFQIKTSNDTATFEANGAYKEGGVQVINKSGSLLPSTGGIGTTIFYVVGSILLVGAAVLLITRRRMNTAR